MSASGLSFSCHTRISNLPSTWLAARCSSKAGEMTMPLPVCGRIKAKRRSLRPQSIPEKYVMFAPGSISIAE